MHSDESSVIEAAERSIRLWITLIAVVAAIALAVYLVRRTRIPDVAKIQQMWKSTGVEYANTDSLTAIRHPHGGRVRVLATAKWGDRLDVFDAASGQFVMRVGKSGDGPGEFRRPNGIVTVNMNTAASSNPAVNRGRIDFRSLATTLAVVERDGARVQLLTGDRYAPIAIIGAGVLHRPYGAAVSYSEEEPLLFVTDTDCPAEETVSVFRLTLISGEVKSELVRRFGDAGPGRIHKAESIVVDDRFNRVLLCDEERSQHNVKVYDLEGKFTGETFGDGIVVGDPEGIVIVKPSELYGAPKDAVGEDFVLLTDQRAKITIWHAFDRQSLAYITSFTGDPSIANTDGICIFEGGFNSHLRGAMFAVNDDADVRAYDLGKIIEFVNAARSSDRKSR
ncbi:MAG TPA: hypothetical protein P5081_15525 [Phycisphaerae bacterium]|nr:hypothetical protein [Phycisphaerae bacterium]HRW54281.1 hypothetical protein [Phycisphaerae bacterium]